MEATTTLCLLHLMISRAPCRVQHPSQPSQRVRSSSAMHAMHPMYAHEGGTLTLIGRPIRDAETADPLHAFIPFGSFHVSEDSYFRHPTTNDGNSSPNVYRHLCACSSPQFLTSQSFLFISRLTWLVRPFQTCQRRWTLGADNWHRLVLVRMGRGCQYRTHYV